MDLKYEFDGLRNHIMLEETEDTWEKISKAMQRFMKIGESGAYDSMPVEVVSFLLSVHRAIASSMNSERTRLSGTAVDLVSSVAAGIGRDFEQAVPIFIPPLLALCARTNKVVVNRAKTAIISIIESTQLSTVLSHFVQNIKDKSATLRLVIAECTLTCLNSCNPPDLEKEARARDIEAIIRGTARDANPDVRKVSRKVFDSYKILFPSRVDSFTSPLSPMTKKYLDIKSTVVISNSKSTAGLRELKLQPSTSTSATTHAVDRTKAHSRAVSSSRVNTGSTAQLKNVPAALTRVSRPETTAAPKVVPNRAIHLPRTAQVTSTSEGLTAEPPGPTRTTSAPEVKRPIPPVRAPSRPLTVVPSQAVSATTTTTSATARRIVSSTVEAKPKTAPASSAPPGSSGPRRVPMPPPPPPAPKKNVEPVRRPASRVDNASSTASNTRIAAPVLPVKKPNAAPSARPRERPVSVKPPVPKFKPALKPASSEPQTTGSAAVSKSAAASSMTKPLAISKTKPQWGRPAAGSKPTATVPKPGDKVVTKKPSNIVGRKPGTKTTSQRPITPALVALPPSPTPDQERNEDQEEPRNNAIPLPRQSAPQAPEVVPRPTTTVLEGATADEGTKEIPTEETITPASISPLETRLPTPTNEPTEASPATPDVYDDNTAELCTPKADQPRTPHANFLVKPIAATGVAAAKTPISALLSSIERGFIYSPTTPISPADAYLPTPNGTVVYSHETHAPRIEGPMQPFNYALHANGMGGGLFAASGRDGSRLVCGDIGVVNVAEHDKLYAGQAGLSLVEEHGRAAFSELNQ